VRLRDDRALPTPAGVAVVLMALSPQRGPSVIDALVMAHLLVTHSHGCLEEAPRSAAVIQDRSFCDPAGTPQEIDETNHANLILGTGRACRKATNASTECILRICPTRSDAIILTNTWSNYKSVIDCNFLWLKCNGNVMWVFLCHSNALNKPLRNVASLYLSRRSSQARTSTRHAGSFVQRARGL